MKIDCVLRASDGQLIVFFQNEQHVQEGEFTALLGGCNVLFLLAIPWLHVLRIQHLIFVLLARLGLLEHVDFKHFS